MDFNKEDRTEEKIITLLNQLIEYCNNNDKTLFLGYSYKLEEGLTSSSIFFTDNITNKEILTSANSITNFALSEIEKDISDEEGGIDFSLNT